MENALPAKPLELRKHYEMQICELQEAYGEAMLQMRVLKKYQSLLGDDDK